MIIIQDESSNTNQAKDLSMLDTHVYIMQL